MSVTGKVNGRTVQFNEKDGRYYYTFTSDSDSFEINHLGCDGHSEIENIQVEYGNEMTKFSDPYTTSNPFSGLLRDLTHIRLQMTDPNSEFRSQLLLTNKGLLTEFENGKMKQALALTSQQFTNQISSLEETDREIRRQLTEVVRTAEGIKSSVKSEYIDSITRKITQLESDQIQTSREVSTKLTSSEVRQLVGGMGYVTTQTFNHTRDLADVHSRILGRTEAGAPTKLAEMVMSAEVFRREITRIENTASENTRSSLTQLSNSIDLGIFGSSGALSRIVLNPSGVKIKGELVHITGQTKIDNAVITSAMIRSVDAGKVITGTLDAAKARIINLDVNSLTGNKSSFLQSLWRATNSLSYIDGTKVQVRSDDGSYVEMNNVPEFRSSDPTGTATVMGMGRTHYLDKYGTSLGYIGMNLYDFDFDGVRTYAGTKYGVWLSRGSGGFSINYMQDGGYVAGTNNVYYTTKAGETYPVSVIEAVMRYKRNAGNWGNFEWVKSTLSTLNGYGAWPWNTTFKAGDKVIIEKGTLSTYIASGYRRYLDCTTSSNGTPTIYTYTEVRHQEGVIMEKGLWVKGQARVGSLRNDSDRRLKKHIKSATSSALEELMALKVVEFDWKQSGQHQDYGLIAQEAGKFRVPANDEEDTESIDLTRLLHASVKAIQELTERVKELETRTVN